ncbi:hypothetical protein TTHERM_00670260 (macronuclear) [Tetrahymena thermophila SB210]|uniref:Uncharacterized protein n=1 Tax=Tetrahymena thermophila (strain SB210) TaxID=312017 RepID=I7MAT3_TETTS|nr:hypothetical protein TTHERM_00670260 [Tetrahymena thermophila SB210]EAS06102.2 hypothetical protein TTHERM_00670260 [Tetrahymena thermophila SB210]|eukprot:XP_001026347.2 hypothetical protein TTHERM_00670260 [Tetrahymena thermophila SB210]
MKYQILEMSTLCQSRTQLSHQLISRAKAQNEKTKELNQQRKKKHKQYNNEKQIKQKAYKQIKRVSHIILNSFLYQKISQSKAYKQFLVKQKCQICEIDQCSLLLLNLILKHLYHQFRLCQFKV